MKMSYLAALVLAVAVTVGGCLSPSDLSKYNPAFEDAVADVMEKRAEEGKPIDSPLTTEEWAYILLTMAGVTAAGGAGLNAHRNKTRKKAIGRT